MKQRREHGFTLIELLVVIAIIGILAAMLFPVFARARESARKTQCLANVKNIAMAFQIYLTDYDRMPPGGHDQGYQAAFDAWAGDSGCKYATWSNPFLRWQVILDEYVKSRAIWSCPGGCRDCSSKDSPVCCDVADRTGWMRLRPLCRACGPIASRSPSCCSLSSRL